ncbi:MAG: type II secretion system protein [Phycisphaerae bacterium]
MNRVKVSTAFTLIELLVVVAIIALLISILLPGLNDAREQARRAKCGANLHSIGTALFACGSENNGFLPHWDDGGAALGTPRVMYTWVDALFDMDYIGDVRVTLCPTDTREDAPMVARGIDWSFNFVDRFGVGERLRAGVRTSYAQNLLAVGWNQNQNRHQDAARQVQAMDGWWTWIGNLQAMWLMRWGSRGDPVGTPLWQGAMSGWRHGKNFSANTLFMDGHVGVLVPRPQQTLRDWRTKTVDTVQAFTWLPGEQSWRRDWNSYGWGPAPGEIEDYRPRFPAQNRNRDEEAPALSFGKGMPEHLDLNWRTANRMWRKLPSDVESRR